MLAIICPGQGTQNPGMLTPWLQVEGARELLAQWSDRSEVDLLKLGTTASSEQIAQTQNAQPLIVATSLLSASALFPPSVASHQATGHIVVAGHSLGAITAAAIAGVFDFGDAVAIAAKRGKFMAELDDDGESKGGMLAVIGSTLEEVHEAALQSGLQVATVNAPNQVVVAGPLERLDAFQAPGKARTIRLMVSGPFHTAAYHGASEKLAAELQNYRVSAPRIPIINDLDGEELSTENAVGDYLVAQVTSPVRWDLVTKRLTDATGIIELSPAGTLTRLARRALPAPVVSLDSLDAIAAGQELFSAHLA